MMSSIGRMRTTVHLDDDVLAAVQERARRDRRTVGQVLSDLARRALTAPRAEYGTGRHGLMPLAPRGPAVSNTLIDRLREDEPE